MLREAIHYTRLAAGLGRLRFARLEPNPVELMRRYVENREENFLLLMRDAVFQAPANPYQSLFNWAGCEYGDLAAGVRADGLETTLESLRKAGVYVLHDEYKGKRPIQRGSFQLEVTPDDFANPNYRGTLSTMSSGSRSRGTVTSQSTEYLVYREAQEQVFLEELGISRRKHIRMSSILPSTGGIRRGLLMEKRGCPVDKWFALGGTFRESGHYQVVTRLLMLEARMLGVPATLPTFLPQNDFAPVAQWLARRKSEGFDCMLSAGVSNGVRVAAAAAESGLDISGTLIRAHGEALTDAKRSAMEAVGAKPYSGYTISELGKIGGSCLHMTSGNGAHVSRDAMALISYPKKAPLTDVEVESLMLTTLLPFAPTVVVNVEMDDSGVLAPAKCDCTLTRIGLTQTVTDIFSYGKLTGQGMTLMGSDLLQILERKLPDRFGGGPTDYQLVEQEGAHQTEVELRVHPSIATRSIEEVKSYFLSELRQVYGGSLSSRNWSQTNGVKVVFAEPYTAGTRGKVHPLHLLGTHSRQQSSGLDAQIAAGRN